MSNHTIKGSSPSQSHPSPLNATFMGINTREQAALAAGTTQPPTASNSHFRSIWTTEPQSSPRVVVPGLAWAGCVTLLTGAPKIGKTALLANAISAWQGGRTFLGESSGPTGRGVLYCSEMPVAILRSWLERYGCPTTNAPVIAGGSAAIDAIVEEARKRRPELLVIDSLTDLHAASGVGNLWNAGDVRKLLQPLRALDCAIILTHHVRKSDGASRDSGDVAAFADMNVALDPASRSGPTPPPQVHGGCATSGAGPNRRGRSRSLRPLAILWRPPRPADRRGVVVKARSRAASRST